MLKRLIVIVSVLIIAAALLALRHVLAQIDLGAVLTELRSFSLARGAAAVALVASYLLINSGNELLLFRSAHGQPAGARPMVVALIANPIGHNVGFAALSAGAIRLRLYSAHDVPPARIARIVAMSVLPFMLGAPTMIALAILSDPERIGTALRIPAWSATAVACALLAAMSAVMLLAKRRHTLTWRNTRLQLPPLWFLATELSLGAIEIVLVAGVLYLFLPAAHAPSYLSFIGIFLTAVLLAQLSNAPAGLGVLEAALITLLPSIPTPQLLAAMIAYRAAFELLPLTIALLLLALFELGSPSGVFGRLWRRRA